MSTSTTPPSDDRLDPFETRLLAELRREVSDRGSVAAVVPAAPGTARRRTRRLAAVTGAVATLGVGLALGPGTAPAYSVVEGNLGEVLVEVKRPEDAAGLERALSEAGITADVTYLDDLARCAPGRYRPVGREVGLALEIGDEQVEVTLPPGAVRSDETFVMVWSLEALTEDELAAESGDGYRSVGGSTMSVSAEVARGPVAPCEVVPARGA